MRARVDALWVLDAGWRGRRENRRHTPPTPLHSRTHNRLPLWRHCGTRVVQTWSCKHTQAAARRGWSTRSPGSAAPSSASANTARRGTCCARTRASSRRSGELWLLLWLLLRLWGCSCVCLPAAACVCLQRSPSSSALFCLTPVCCRCHCASSEPPKQLQRPRLGAACGARRRRQRPAAGGSCSRRGGRAGSQRRRGRGGAARCWQQQQQQHVVVAGVGWHWSRLGSIIRQRRGGQRREQHAAAVAREGA